MKLKSHNVETRRLSGDHRTQVLGQWTDKMRRPTRVSVSFQPVATGTPTGATEVIEGVSQEVYDTLGGLAEIAWSMGWRPRGLEGHLSMALKGFEILPEES